MRFFSLLFLTLGLALAAPGPAVHARHAATAQRAQAAHLARLAAKEKKAWRTHLAKLKTLPRAQRVAEKRHERLWKRQHDAKVEAKLAAPRPKVARAKVSHAKVSHAKVSHAKAARANAARLAAGTHARNRASLQASRLASVRAMHSAAIAQDLARRTAHARRLAAQARAHHALASAQATARQKNAARNAAQNAARRRALLALKQSHWQKLTRAHLANAAAARNARLLARRSHWVALHGDGGGGRSIRFWQTAAANVPVKVISVDLNDPDVKVSAVMARRGNGTSEPFKQMISRANPNVAVTGTFFSLDNLQPVGDIVIDGSLVHFGGMGTALCITPRNRAEMVTCQWGRHHDWRPYDFVVACGPRLLSRGRIVLDPRGERFRDKHMLAPNSRIAVGITRGNTLFFVMTHAPIYLGRLARVMQALGAREAMNLDAGTSTGFYYNGATLAKPGRKLTNMIVVYGRRDRYERALGQLVPAAYRRRVSQAPRP